MVRAGMIGGTQSTRVPSSCSEENLNKSSDLRVDRGLPRTGNTRTHGHTCTYIDTYTNTKDAQIPPLVTITRSVQDGIISNGVATTVTMIIGLSNIATGIMSCQSESHSHYHHVVAASAIAVPPLWQLILDLTSHHMLKRANLNELLPLHAPWWARL